MSDDRGERFLAAFNDVEHVIRRAHPDRSLRQGARRVLDDASLGSRLADFDEFAELRNAIVHGRHDEGHLIAEPSASVVADIEALRDALLAPPAARDHLTSPVRSVAADAPLASALTLMADEGLAWLPVTRGGEHDGLLGYRAIARWLAHAWAEKPAVESVPVADVLAFGRAHARFLPADASIAQVVAALRHRSTGAVLLSADGQPTAKPLAIATTADVSRLHDAGRTTGGEDR